MDISNIAFIGAGNMARCIINGLIHTGTSPETIWASDPKPEQLAQLSHAFAIHTASNNQACVNQCTIIILCVKPNHIKAVLEEIQPALTPKHIVASIAAGISVNTLKNLCPKDTQVIRCMPNIAAFVGAATTLIYAASDTSKQAINQIEAIMRAIGSIIYIQSEEEFHIGTALSGSGPGFIFKLASAMQSAAISLGLGTEQARKAILDTLLGSARMAMESERSLTELCDMVTSPGGTTQAGLAVLEQNDIDEIILKMLRAAVERSQEMSKES